MMELGDWRYAAICASRGARTLGLFPIHFGLIRRCMRRPGIHSTDAGNLRVLSRCLASSLAATDSMVYRPFLHQRWAVLPSSPSGTTRHHRSTDCAVAR
jgi:hypothetical protein